MHKSKFDALVAEQKELHDKIFAERGNVHMTPVQKLWNRLHVVDAAILGVK